jgi:hypothetical protein
MVPPDDEGLIQAKSGHFMVVFHKAKAETLPLHQSIDHAIEFEPGYSLPYRRIYNLLEFELRTLKAYIKANQSNGFIHRSSMPAAAPTLFEKKMDGELRLFLTIVRLTMRR